VEIDLTHVPRGELAARALVQALAETDDRAERHFLEVKSAIDLRSKEGVAKVAKFILGAANRMPDVAARYFDGHAVLVLGVAPGATPGIEPVEALDTERGVRPYLSANGPRWDLQRVPLEAGREVLLVLVDPPKAGQPAFPCFKDGPAGLHNGEIIIRADGETRQATGEEVVQLFHRARGGGPDVEVAVAVDGVAVAYRCDVRVLDEHIAQETARLRAARASMTSSSATMFSPAVFATIGQHPEPRTPEQYEDEIAAWAAACRERWPSALDRLAAAFAPPVAISAVNLEESFLEDVHLELHLDGPVRGLEPTDRQDFDANALLPSPPRRWGPWRDTSLYRSLIAPPLYPRVGPMSLPSVTFRNGGSVTVEVKVGDLRPRQTYRTRGDLLVLVGDPEARVAELSGTWKIAARGHHSVFEGSLVVAVASRDVTAAMERALALTRGEGDADEEVDAPR
jgi:hypothetical protein